MRTGWLRGPRPRGLQVRPEALPLCARLVERRAARPPRASFQGDGSSGRAGRPRPGSPSPARRSVPGGGAARAWFRPGRRTPPGRAGAARPHGAGVRHTPRRGPRTGRRHSSHLWGRSGPLHRPGG
ncbi:hypothetical protein DFI_19955 (plasmid) [Deinococcus ficus]|uniref:Uncharacterized protein n=1 Tax=Deinococcus ficus TaxID=317577 RepID=A0A221T3I5_9DEIO|nr:hypothetical protein DFI_19955 [Deinococcus ficus]